MLKNPEPTQGGVVVLVLSRDLNEPIVIGEDIFVKVMRGKNGQFKIVVDAPKDVRIRRGEQFPGMAEVEARWAKTLRA